jgi:hypothetical protein
MGKTIISLILLLTLWAPALGADAPVLRDDAPDQHVVVPGDTLWGISGRFLKDAWRWPELWRMNQEQIRNPHRIYPGNVIVLDRATGQLRLQVERLPTHTLSPRIRAEALPEKAVPTITPSVIDAFLSRPLVVGRTELDGLPVIRATEENRVVIGAGNIAYVEGIANGESEIWHVFRRGDALIDPDTRETLGYEAIDLGEARMLRHGEFSTVEITRSTREMYVGDRLMPASREQAVFSYVPRAPAIPVRGRIVSAYGNLGETGPLGIVTLSKGSHDGLEVGHVLAIYRSQAAARFGLRTSPLYGRQGPSGQDRPRTYYSEQLTPRDAPLYPRPLPINEADTAKLPDERYGLVMVFRTFDRAAYALVMQASRPVSLHDVVANPE